MLSSNSFRRELSLQDQPHRSLSSLPARLACMIPIPADHMAMVKINTAPAKMVACNASFSALLCPPFQ